MRADQAHAFVLPEETLTIPELGGDGVVRVRGIGFGRKVYLATEAPKFAAAAMLASESVVDEDGFPLMSADAWDAFAAQHEERFLELLQAAKRVSGFDAADVKKD